MQRVHCLTSLLPILCQLHFADVPNLIISACRALWSGLQRYVQHDRPAQVSYMTCCHARQARPDVYRQQLCFHYISQQHSMRLAASASVQAAVQL